MQLTKKIDNTQISESVYRDMKTHLNATGVKMFIDDREGFIKEYIYGETRVYKGSAATIMGSLVHCLILEKEQFDDKYTITQMTPPTGQMLELVNEMYRIDCKTRTADGKQTVQFEQIFSEAVQQIKYQGGIEEVAFKKKAPEVILGMFTEPDKKTGVAAEKYYAELLSNHGKTVVSMFQITKAEQIVQEMQNNPWVNEWINAATTMNKDVFNEYPITFKYKDLEMKGLLDRIIVDHIRETIEVVDIKSTWDGDGVSYTYIKNIWYIQAAVYKKALQQFALDNDWGDYKIENMRFLTCDTTGFHKSCSYQCTDEDIQKAEDGFFLQSGKYCPGLIETLEEIISCKETGVWNVPKKVIEANGQMKFEIPYK